MKERELRNHAECDYCKKKIVESMAAVPAFFVVEVTGYILDLPAIRQQDGFGMALGTELAAIMGPDKDLATEKTRDETTMCWACWTRILPQPGHHNEAG